MCHCPNLGSVSLLVYPGVSLITQCVLLYNPMCCCPNLGSVSLTHCWYTPQPPDDELTHASGPLPPFTPIRSPSRAFGTNVPPAIVNQIAAAPILTPVPPTTFPDNSVAPPPSSSGQRAPKSSAIS